MREILKYKENLSLINPSIIKVGERKIYVLKLNSMSCPKAKVKKEKSKESVEDC